MRASIQLAMDKETENKYRWCVVLDDDVEFKLYIPKWRCPPVPPRTITVEVLGNTAPLHDDRWDVMVEVARYKDHTETIRYRPHGDPDDWEIGEPYVPYCVLPCPWPDRIAIGVAWG